MARQLDQFMHVRVGTDQKAALEAVAKARGETAGALIRAAVDAVVLKDSGRALTEAQREQVVEKATPAVAEALAELDAVREAVEGVVGRLGALEVAGR